MTELEKAQMSVGAIVMDACAALAGTDAVYADLRKQIIDAKVREKALTDEADLWRKLYNDLVADFNELSEKYETLKETTERRADGGKAGAR